MLRKFDISYIIRHRKYTRHVNGKIFKPYYSQKHQNAQTSINKEGHKVFLTSIRKHSYQKNSKATIKTRKNPGDRQHLPKS